MTVNIVEKQNHEILFLSQLSFASEHENYGNDLSTN